MVENWTIRFYRSARRELRSIQDEDVKDEIIQAILALVEDPNPEDSVKLEGQHHLYRIRIGAWTVKTPTLVYDFTPFSRYTMFFS
jgi:mRNA-degrading endonuclease RelE of RelBE toxin-antitoxin system